MKDYIPKSDYKQHADDLARGEQVKVDHDDCTAGVDTKQRLYIKRTDDGKRVLAYCHNCGLSGSYSEDVFGHLQAKKNSGHAFGRGRRSYTGLPKDCETSPTEWTSAARAWVFKFGFRDSEVESAGITYSPSLDRVVLPCTVDGEEFGYQSRRLSVHDPKPKYLTEAKKRPLFSTYKCQDTTIIHPPLVICEDILSALKSSRFADSVALLTSTPNNNVISWIVNQGYTKFIVFLDNDNRQVRESQRKLRDRLSVFGEVEVILADRDPKEHTNQELRGLLT